MLRRVKETFQAANIDMPYPTQVSINKSGDPEPVRDPPPPLSKTAALVSAGRQA